MRPSSLDTPTSTAKWLFLSLVVFFDKNKNEKKRSPPKKKRIMATPPFRIGKRPLYEFSKSARKVPVANFPPYFFERLKENFEEKKRSPPKIENEYGHAPIPYRETPPL